MRRKLRKLKKFLLSRDPNDEFFYVPSGRGPEHNENMNIDDTNKNCLEPTRESRPRRVRERSRQGLKLFLRSYKWGSESRYYI